jgi:hypothetical protein
VTGLADESRGRADQDEAAVAVPLHLTEEGARGEERGGEVGADRLFPALEGQLPDRHVLLRPDAGDGGADVDPAEGLARLGEDPLDVVLPAEVAPHDRVRPDRLGAIPALVVVRDDASALAPERADAGCADPAGAAGDEDALPGESGLHLAYATEPCGS